MRQRTLLGVGAGTLSLAGCLSTGVPTDESEEGRRYEECMREVIPYDQFTPELQTEIDAAINDEYEAARVYLAEAMAVDESYVSVDDTYYDPSVTVMSEQERLELDAVEPKALPDPRTVNLKQHRDGERTISVTVTADDGTVLVDETRTLHPYDDVEVGQIRRVGSHELRATVGTGEEIEDEFERSIIINESRFSVDVLVREDEISVGRTVAMLPTCEYE